MLFISVFALFSGLVSAALQSQIPVYEECPSDYTTFPLTCTRGCGITVTRSWGCIGCTEGRWGCHNDCYRNEIIDCFNHPANTIQRAPKCPSDYTFAAGLCYKCDNPEGFTKCIAASMASGAAPAIAGCAFAGAETLGVTCAISALAIGGAAAGCVISEC
ncbi:hypothetical protein BC833DRAFT_620404 [Globomyces pollinis-pini]|nr:hypothetical protein BC833DRAFT_620404 [Globomyces pollinis-pini]